MSLSKQAIVAIQNQWHPARDRVLWAPVFLGAGIALYFALAQEPSFGASAGGLASAALILILSLKRFPNGAYLAFALFLAALGFMLAHGRGLTVAAPMLDRVINITRVEGRVLDVSVADDEVGKKGRRRVTMGDLQIERLMPQQMPARVRLSSYHIPEDTVPGDRIAVLTRLMPPSGPVAPGGFDYRRQAFFEQIGAVGFTLGGFTLIAPAQEHKDVWFNTLRQIISKRINASLPHPESAVAMALLAGERANIPDAVNQDLIDSGLYHLLSISGLHVAIVCGVTFFILRFLMALSPYLALHWPIKKIAAIAATAIGVFYMLLAGAPIPAQRAMLMTGLVLLAVMLDRSALSIRTIALAAFAVLFVAPESLVGASFQLSFAAVLAMIAFHEERGRKVVIETRGASFTVKTALYVWGIVLTTLLVGVATMPIVLHHFGRIQLYGILANAAAIPLTSFIVMPAGMAALLVMPLGWEAPFLKIVGWGVTATLDIAAWVAHLPHAAWAIPSLPFWPFLLSAFGFLLVALWRGSFRWMGMPLVAAAMIWGYLIPRPVAMVDIDARSLGVSHDSQVAYVFKTPPEFVRKQWMSLWGGTEHNNGKPVKQVEGFMLCDDFACRIGENLSVLKNRAALHEECAWAKIIIAIDKAVDPHTPCAAKIVSSWDVKHGGGYAVYPDGFARPMTLDNQNRPWSSR